MSDAHKATPADAVLAVLRATPERQAPASAWPMWRASLACPNP
jgi:hypothetical protein